MCLALATGGAGAAASQAPLAKAPAKKAPAPHVDPEAMREAMDSAAHDDPAASSASYAHYLQSRLLHLEGNHRGAVDELRLALATDDGNPRLLTQLGEEYARLGDLDRAERELRRAVEKSPAYYPAHVLLGRVLMESGRLTRARQHLRRAMTLRLRDPEAYLVLSQLHLDAKAPDEAVKVVEALAHALPGEASGYRRLGLALAERGDTARAERLLTKAAERDPGDVEVWSTLARMYEEAGRAKEAEDALARALEADPDSREVLLSAGRAALKSGSVTRARAYFDRLLSLSSSPELAVRVAFSYLSAHESAAAEAVLDAARKDAPDEPRLAYYAGLVAERMRRFSTAATAFADVPPNAEVFLDARVRRARCLSLAGDHARALVLYRAAVKETPEDPELRVAHARALERSGSAAKAEGVLREALGGEGAAMAYEALAALLERQGRPAEALTLLRDAVARSPKDQDLLFSLGAALDRQGDVAGALSRMRMVLAVAPEHSAAMNFIGYLLAQHGRDLDEAERLVRRALALRPDSAAYVDSLGWVYFQRGEARKAVELLERAVELAPDEPAILEHLGDAYLKAARASDAAASWKRALDVLTLEPEAAEPAGQRTALERKLKALPSPAPGR
ncbi:tetratricopeptide repeat protein [Corallococcus sp. CA047B]|nr:tetratricopeptide repeat protein [Corallococcus sp. CA047B]